MNYIILLVVVFAAITNVYAQTWCGKNYLAGAPVVPPGGEFATPPTSSSPLMAFRCAPAIKPYLAEDASEPGAILIDTTITHAKIAGAAPISIREGSMGVVVLVVEVDGQIVSGGAVPLNVTKFELPFSLTGLTPRKAAYDVSCTATYQPPGSGERQMFNATASLAYLPDPTGGSSVVKLDARTGALLAKPANGEGGAYEPVLPIGFYTGFGDYLATNLSLIDEAKAQGFTVIHPIPGDPDYGNTTQLQAVIQRMQEVGMYLMYDMRWSYMNDTLVAEQVEMVKNSPALLLWYTGDEPDGSSDPLNATSHAYDLIYDLDGYHPVSLCLNCYDYYWSDYAAGADIILQDAYMISINATWSIEWNTSCTPDFGDCGCDDCNGDFEDISNRMDTFAHRLWVNGWDRTKAIWTTPQAFGGSQYWPRIPTGQEFIVQSVLALNHGGMGVIAWEDPTTDDIWAYASMLAQSSSTLKAYIMNDAATFQHVFSNQIDIGLWTVDGKTLMLATNLNYAEESFDLASIAGLTTSQSTQVLNSGAALSEGVITFNSVGTGGFIFG